MKEKIFIWIKQAKTEEIRPSKDVCFLKIKPGELKSVNNELSTFGVI